MPFKQNRLGLACFSTSRKEISAATELLVRCGKSHQMKKKSGAARFVGVTMRIWAEKHHKEQYRCNMMQLSALP